MKKILSIDGGGIRGLIPALVLAEIEKKTGKAISSCFDLIAGTSTGGILALGLGKQDDSGKPQYAAKDLVKIYQNHGAEIFHRSFWKGMASVGGIADELYSAQGLETLLDDYFGGDTLGDSLTRLLITSYDIEQREPLFLKSWREEFKSVHMKHAARATSAAPTYFEPALIPVGGAMRALVDGGVFVNSPVVSAFAEAKRIFEDENEFFVLSLGTGELIRRIEYVDAKNWGKLDWILPLLSCMFDGVSDAADYQMSKFLGEQYIRLQTNLSLASDDMDNASAGNIENLKLESRKLLKDNKDKLSRIYDLLSA